jgi:hypothetical protein
MALRDDKEMPLTIKDLTIFSAQLEKMVEFYVIAKKGYAKAMTLPVLHPDIVDVCGPAQNTFEIEISDLKIFCAKEDLCSMARNGVLAMRRNCIEKITWAMNRGVINEKFAEQIIHRHFQPLEE